MPLSSPICSGSSTRPCARTRCIRATTRSTSARSRIFASRFAPCGRRRTASRLQVSDTEFSWCDVPVLSEPEKVSDSLPWTLFKDGVRELTLTRGFEGEELEKFLEDHSARAARAGSRGRHPHAAVGAGIRVSVVPLHRQFIGAGRAARSVGDAGALARASRPRPIPSRRSPKRRSAARTRTPPAAVPTKAAASTARSPRRRAPTKRRRPRRLHRRRRWAISRARSSASTRPTCAAPSLDVLLDIFELNVDAAVREEVAGHLDSMMLHLLTGLQFGNVTHLLRESGVVLERATGVSPSVRARIEVLSDRVSDPDLLGPLLAAVSDAAAPPPIEEFADFVRRLRPRALGTLFIWSAQAKNADVRRVLADAADLIAESNPDELMKLISSPDPLVAAEAVKRAAASRSEAAVPALAKVLGLDDEQLRDRRRGVARLNRDAARVLCARARAR